MSKLRDRTAGQERQRLPLPRLPRAIGGLPRLWRLAGNQDGRIRPFPGLLELARLRLHAKHVADAGQDIGRMLLADSAFKSGSRV